MNNIAVAICRKLLPSIGTRSILYGVHCFFIHPWFVALGWWKLYGFPFDPRLWVAFFVHDLGYWGKPNMDGEEGEAHPFTGAAIMGALFDVRGWKGDYCKDLLARACNFVFGEGAEPIPVKRVFDNAKVCWQFPLGDDEGEKCIDLKRTWYCFTFYHSRFLSKQYQTHPSRLCWADKAAIILTPWFLYRMLSTATGELHEYMRGQGARDPANGRSPREWFNNVRNVVRHSIAEAEGIEL